MKTDDQLDFQDPPKTVHVPFPEFIRFCGLCHAGGIAIFTTMPKRGGYYTVSLSKPVTEEMALLTCAGQEDSRKRTTKKKELQ